jgi:hypothetical protein
LLERGGEGGEEAGANVQEKNKKAMSSKRKGYQLTGQPLDRTGFESTK